MTRSRRMIPGGLIAAAMYSSPLSVWGTETGITTEAIDSYVCNPYVNPQNIANADNFRNRMLSIPGFTQGVRWTNTNVWQLDFQSPSQVMGGLDFENFDRPGDAISYFNGHGSCDDSSGFTCTTTAGCPDFPPLQKRCVRTSLFPVSGTCMYSKPRIIFTNRFAGTDCDHPEEVDYSNQVRWGESPSSGGWAGAGTNGGINFAVIDNSCGVTPDLHIPQLENAFAGISSIALIMPTRPGDDSGSVSTRGQAFANRYVSDPTRSIAPSWADAINSVSGGTSCLFGGGGHGILGCGAHIAISSGVTEADALWHNRTETWVQSRDENNDVRGNTWFAWIFTCNYNCNATPFILP